MNSRPPRISLSIGRASDGPRTTGDINILGLSLALYQLWLYVAVFNAPLLFGSLDDAQTTMTMETGFLQNFDIHTSVIIDFLAASAVCLLILATCARKAVRFVQSNTTTIGFACLCIAGTACIALGDGLGGAAPLIAGLLMGAGSSLFLVRWGSLYARFRFVTAVLNAGLSLAASLITAVALANWVPAPILGIIAACIPITFPALFWSRDDASADTMRSRIPSSEIIGYYVRLAVCLAAFGIVLGMMCTLCVSKLPTTNNTTIELLLGAGSITGAVIFIVALALSKRETKWDWLFRVIAPIVTLGCASMPFLIGDATFASTFFFSLGYICLEVLLWVLLVSLASEINGIFICGLGFGTLNLTSIVGVGLATLILNLSPIEGIERTQNALAMAALLLCILTMTGYALLPRYYELKGILSSVLSSLATLNDMHEHNPAKSSALQDAHIATDTAVTPNDEPIITSGTMPDIAPITEPDTTADASADHADTPAHNANEMPDALSAEQPAESRDEKGSFMRRCDEISHTYKLSGREQEVLVLLAKGHNASFIMDKLCISRSTTKTHINHIYKKLNIHTQQELLNMVEDRKRHVTPGPDKPTTPIITGGAMGAAVPQSPEKLKEVVLQAHIQQHNH